MTPPDVPAELIQYERAAAAGPTESHYSRSPVDDPVKVKEFLAAAQARTASGRAPSAIRTAISRTPV